jgi:hypothetical protein
MASHQHAESMTQAMFLLYEKQITKREITD